MIKKNLRMKLLISLKVLLNVLNVFYFSFKKKTLSSKSLKCGENRMDKV